MQVRGSLVRATALTFALATGGQALADEAGVSAWIPGFFGSMAAAPMVPGPQLASMYYHSSVDASGNDEFVSGGGISVGIDGDADILIEIPGYVFEEPVLGGQVFMSMAIPFGHMKASADVTLTGPNGGDLHGERTDRLTAFGDLAPFVSLRWSEGVNNLMVFGTVGVPVGSYDEDRLANLGIGHASINGGVGYTYFDHETGYEFSLVPGLTYNFENKHTEYQNGVDFHLDWGASKFFESGWQIGAVGYAYQQITGDEGDGAVLGDFKSRVFGVGPQIGYSFPIGGALGYLNLKGYYEFGAENRSEGWNTWVTFALSPQPPHAAPVK
jgi:hypothetical protein